MITMPYASMPGVSSEITATPRILGFENPVTLRAGCTIDGSKTRDPGSSPSYDVRAGILLGKITASKKYAPSILGAITNAEAAGSTQIEVSAAVATEIVRRLGATGTLKLTGPPTAGGTVRSLSVAYSAVNTGTGAVTVTALGVNEVQTVSFGAAATAGTVKLGFTLANGAVVWTDTAAWSATDATFLGNINTAIDNLLGAGLVVATAIAATDTDLGFVLTFSGAGYAALSQALVQVDASALTSVTTVTVTRTTAGVDGRFIAGSLVQPADGSENPCAVFDGRDGYPIRVVDENVADRDVSEGKLVIGCDLVDPSAAFLNWPSDTSLRAWIKAQLRANGGPRWGFEDDFR